MSGGLPEEAAALLRRWLPADDDPDRPRMQLATVDERGRPDVRTVLLSEWGGDGFAFHTDSRSRKVAHLEARPHAALLLLGPDAAQQLSVQGRVEAMDAERARPAWDRRSPYLRRLARRNTVELAQLPRAERVAAWQRSAAEDAAADGPPATWAGFLVRPDRLTFWQADPDGPSHRVEHRRADDGAWSVHHLPG